MILGARRKGSRRAGLAIVLTVMSLWAMLDTLPAEDLGKVLILPFQVSSGKNEEELRAFALHVNKRLQSTVELLKDRYTAQSRQVVDDVLKGKPWPEDDSEARDLAAKAGADYVVYGHLSEENGAFRMRAIMWDLRQSKQAVGTELKVGNIHGLPAVLELFVAAVGTRLGAFSSFYNTKPVSPASRELQPSLPVRPGPVLPRKSGPWRSPTIATELWALAIGDLLGDGKNEVVLLDEGGLSISRFENSTLKLLTRFSRAPARFLTAEVVDLDGDGVEELILCTMTPQGIGSSIIKYRNRDFKILQQLPHTIVRSISDPDDGKQRLVVGQKTDIQDMFSGEMVRLRYQEGQLVPKGTVMLPPGTLLLSYVDGRMGKNQEFLRIILSQDQRLMVFDQDNRLLYQAMDRIYGLERGTVGPLNTGTKSVFYPGKLMISDTSGGGDNELLVVKQTRGASAIHALVWDGAKLAEKWKTIESRGIISDFTIKDLKTKECDPLL